MPVLPDPSSTPLRRTWSAVRKLIAFARSLLGTHRSVGTAGRRAASAGTTLTSAAMQRRTPTARTDAMLPGARASQCRLEVVGQRRLDLDALTGDRVRKRQSGSVEELPL